MQSSKTGRDALVLKRQKSLWVKKVQRNNARSALRKGTGGTITAGHIGSALIQGIRTILAKTKLMNMTFTAAGALALSVIMMITMFGSAFYTPGGEEYSDDPTFWNVYGNGIVIRESASIRSIQLQANADRTAQKVY